MRVSSVVTGALTAFLLTACSPSVEVARPAPDLCVDPVDGPDCTEAVVGELRRELRDVAGAGQLAAEQYEQAATRVISERRIAGTWGYERLGEVPELAPDEEPPAVPLQFRLSTAGHATSWWVCLPEPVVQQEPCP